MNFGGATNIPVSLEMYAIWMAGWIAIWAAVAFVWLQVHWIRRAVHAYHNHSIADQLVARAKHVRDHHAKPAISQMQRQLRQMRRQFKDWRCNR